MNEGGGLEKMDRWPHANDVGDDNPGNNIKGVKE